jgi:manganese/zinc/iron transport system permease protein
MLDLIPAFNFEQVFLEPWRGAFSESQPGPPAIFWIALMGFFVSSACGMVGAYLILRRMALVGDAISHSVLPGIAISFLLSGSRGSLAMVVGALAAGMVTTLIIEVIHRKSRIKHDAAIGIAFTTLFAIGVILISVFAGQVDLDQECVLYGEIAWVPLEETVAIRGVTLGPEPVVRMGIVLVLTAALIIAFYKELLVSSFDAGLASSLGINATMVHYALMCWLSVVVVSAFESVGAILVIAMLILPAATSSLLSSRLSTVLFLSILHSGISSFLGIHLAYWLNCSMAAAMVVMGAILFVLAWIFSPERGILSRLLHRHLTEAFPAEEGELPTKLSAVRHRSGPDRHRETS